MSHIVLFHHVLGLTPGIQQLADRLRTAGHRVSTPDLFQGRRFDDLQAGLAHVGEIGDAELLRRAEQACDEVPTGVVYAGLSLGAMCAQHLLQTRVGAAGGLLLHAFIEPTQLGGSWPDECPVDVFAMDRDPFFVGDGDHEAAQRWQATHPNLRIHLYPGGGHLFTEPGSPDHDASATNELVVDMLAALEGDEEA